MSILPLRNHASLLKLCKIDISKITDTDDISFILFLWDKSSETVGLRIESYLLNTVKYWFCEAAILRVIIVSITTDTVLCSYTRALWMQKDHKDLVNAKLIALLLSPPPRPLPQELKGVSLSVFFLLLSVTITTLSFGDLILASLAVRSCGIPKSCSFNKFPEIARVVMKIAKREKLQTFMNSYQGLIGTKMGLQFHSLS